MERLRGENGSDWRDILPDEPIQIIVGYKDDATPITEEVTLRTAFDNEGAPTISKKYYLEYMRHSEETDQVLQATTMYNTPEQYDRASDINHLDCDLTEKNEDAVCDFHDRVSDHLEIRGYTLDELRAMTLAERQALLSACLHKKES